MPLSLKDLNDPSLWGTADAPEPLAEIEQQPRVGQIPPVMAPLAPVAATPPVVTSAPAAAIAPEPAATKPLTLEDLNAPQAAAATKPLTLDDLNTPEVVQEAAPTAATVDLGAQPVQGVSIAPKSTVPLTLDDLNDEDVGYEVSGGKGDNYVTLRHGLPPVKVSGILGTPIDQARALRTAVGGTAAEIAVRSLPIAVARYIDAATNVAEQGLGLERNRLSKKVEEIVAPHLPTKEDKKQAEEVLGKWPYLIASGVGSTLPMVLTAPFGVAPTMALGAASVMSEFGDDASEHEATAAEIAGAQSVGGVIGLTEAASPLMLVQRFRKLPGGLDALKVFGKALGPKGRIAATALLEGSQEWFENTAQNLTASDFVGYDPERGALEHGVEAGVAGAGTGAILATMYHVLFGKKMPIKALAEKDLQKAEAIWKLQVEDATAPTEALVNLQANRQALETLTAARAAGPMPEADEQIFQELSTQVARAEEFLTDNPELRQVFAPEAVQIDESTVPTIVLLEGLPETGRIGMNELTGLMKKARIEDRTALEDALATLPTGAEVDVQALRQAVTDQLIPIEVEEDTGTSFDDYGTRNIRPAPQDITPRRKQLFKLPASFRLTDLGNNIFRSPHFGYENLIGWVRSATVEGKRRIIEVQQELFHPKIMTKSEIEQAMEENYAGIDTDVAALDAVKIEAVKRSAAIMDRLDLEGGTLTAEEAARRQEDINQIEALERSIENRRRKLHTLAGLTPSIENNAQRARANTMKKWALHYMVRTQMRDAARAGETSIWFPTPMTAARIQAKMGSAIVPPLAGEEARAQKEWPTWKVYEDLNKWLKDEMGAKLVTDDNQEAHPANIRDTWLEIPLTKDMGRRSIYAFGGGFGPPARMVKDTFENLASRLGSHIEASPAFSLARINAERKMTEYYVAQGLITAKEAKGRYKKIDAAAKKAETRLTKHEQALKKLTAVGPFGNKRPPRKPPSNWIKEGGEDLASDVTHWNQYQDKFWNLLQILERNKHIPGVEAYEKGILEWWQYSSDWKLRADDVLKDWRDLGARSADLVSKALVEVDRESARLNRRLDRGEVAAILSRLQLKPEAGKIVLRVLDYYQVALNEMEAVSVTELEPLRSIDPVYHAQAVRDLHDRFQRMRQKRTYIPHTRFGRRYVAVQNVQTKEIEHFEPVDVKVKPLLERKIAQLRKQLGAKYPGADYVIYDGTLSDQHIRGLMLPDWLKGRLTQDLKLQGGQITALEETFLSFAPQERFLRHLEERKDTPGFSKEMMRSFADYGGRFSNHISRVKFGKSLEQSVQLTLKSAQDINARGGSSTKRTKLGEWMKNHWEYVMNPGNELSSIRAALSVWYLGGRISSAYMNFTQIPMVVYPELAQRFPEDWVESALAKAMAHAPKSLIKPGSYKGAYWQLMRQVIDKSDAVLNQSFAADLAAARRGSYIDIYGTGSTALGVAAKNISSMVMLPFAGVESVNRLTTLVAYADLRIREARANNETVTADQLAEEAMAFVRQTNYEYSPWNRPKFMRGKKGVLFTFYNFIQNTVYRMMHGPAGGRIALMYLMMGGLQALPFMGDIEDLVNTLFTTFPELKKTLGFGDSPMTDIRLAIREMLVDLIGEDDAATEIADLAINGAGRRYGLGGLHLAELAGVPVPNVDISKAIGLGDIIPGTEAFRQLAYGQKLDSVVAAAGEDVAGAAGALVVNMLDAMTQPDPEVWRRVEKGVPRAAASLSKAIRTGAKGEATGMRGATVGKFDLNDPEHVAELVAMGLGFQPSRVSIEGEAQYTAMVHKRFWLSLRGALLRDVTMAIEQGTEEDVQKVLGEVMEYNKDAADVSPALMIRNIGAIRNSFRARIRGAQEVETGGGMEEIKQLYPQQEEPETTTEVLR